MILYPKIICTYIRPTSSREVGKNNNPNKTECTRHSQHIKGAKSVHVNSTQ